MAGRAMSFGARRGRSIGRRGQFGMSGRSSSSLNEVEADKAKLAPKKPGEAKKAASKGSY